MLVGMTVDSWLGVEFHRSPRHSKDKTNLNLENCASNNIDHFYLFLNFTSIELHIMCSLSLVLFAQHMLMTFTHVMYVVIIYSFLLLYSIPCMHLSQYNYSLPY